MRFWLLLVAGVVAVTVGSTLVHMGAVSSGMTSTDPIASLTEEEVKVAKSDVPKVKIDSPERDQGLQVKGEGGENFVITNEGSAPLTVEETGSGCPCAEGSFVKEKNRKKTDTATRITLDAGESATLVMKWDTRKRNDMGEIALVRTLLTNDPEKPEVRCIVKMNLQPELVVEPQVLMFGEIARPRLKQDDPTKLPTATFRVLSPFDETLEVTNLNISRPDLVLLESRKLDAKELEAAAAKAGYVVTARLTDKFPSGSFVAKVAFDTNIGPQRNWEVTMGGEILGDFILRPQSGADFRVISKGNEHKRVVTLFSKVMGDEGQDLTVKKVDIDWLDVKLERLTSTTWKFTATVPATAPEGEFKTAVVLVDNAGKERIVVAVSGAVAALAD